MIGMSRLEFPSDGSNVAFRRPAKVQRWRVSHGAALLLLFAALIAGSGCDRSATERPIRLQLNWYPDAQFGGFYAAKIHGFYEAEGLNVEILPVGPDAAVIPKLAMGRVDFGVGNADQVLLARKEGADLVAVMASMQDCPRCILVHKSSGITSLDQLANVTLAMGEGNPFAEFLKQNLRLTNVRIVPYSGTVAKFLMDDHYAQQGYVFSEPIVAKRRGADPIALLVSDHGFNPYTGVVMTRRATIQNQPERVQKFVRATIRGWQKYLRDPEQTNRTMQSLHPEMDTESLHAALSELQQLCVPDGMALDALGTMSDKRWETLSRQMVELNLIPANLDVQDCYTCEFVGP